MALSYGKNGCGLIAGQIIIDKDLKIKKDFYASNVF